MREKKEKDPEDSLERSASPMHVRRRRQESFASQAKDEDGRAMAGRKTPSLE